MYSENSAVIMTGTLTDDAPPEQVSYTYFVAACQQVSYTVMANW